MAKKKTKKKVTRNKGGRPSKYKPEFNDQAKKLCLLGATDKDLADFFGVNKDTINEWKKKHKGFSDSLKESKAEADARVVRSLYQRAIGYDHTDTHFASYEGEIISKEHMRHFIPDVTACIFWLKNRDPENWRDVHEIVGDLNIHINEKFKGKDGHKD